MKITRIYLKNLNSLCGEFIINLDQEPFANTGIFAITGPTGAGKSTILDAITLALYGRAARYDSKPNPENMMSRGTGECHAEVEFIVSKGKFRASWQMKRARCKPDGKLQPASRYVYDSQDLAIAQNSSEANKVIEELTGLDVDRFFRSVLLAQGDFVKFLKATPDDRATLLEKLTGTGIYTDISKRVHVETSHRENQLKSKELGLENIKLLNKEEHSALSLQKRELQEAIEQNTQKLRELATLITQGNEVVKYLKQRDEFQKQLANINQENLGMQNDLNRLHLYREGVLFYPKLNHFDQAIKNCQDKKNEVNRAENAVVNRQSELRAGIDTAIEMILELLTHNERALLESFHTSDKKSIECKDLNAWLEINKQDQTLDMHLSEIVEKITTLSYRRDEKKNIHREQNKLLQDLEKGQQLVKALQSEKERALLNIEKVKLEVDAYEKKYLHILEGKTVEQIHSGIVTTTEQLNYLEAWEEINQESQEITKTILQLTINSEKSQKTLFESEHTLKSVEENIRKFKELRDENRLIASLHEHREKLELGQACPLCGALDHPFIQNGENPFSKISNLEKELKLLDGELFTKNNEFKNSLSIFAKTEETLKNKKEELKNRLQKSESLKTLLQQYKQGDLQTESLDHEKIRLKDDLLIRRIQLNSAQESERRKNEAQKSFVQVQHDAALVQNNINSYENHIQSHLERLQLIKIAVDDLEFKIIQLESLLLKYLESYNLKLPLDGEEKKLRVSLEERKNVYQKNLKYRDDLSIELSHLHSHSKSLEHQRKNLESQKENLEQLITLHEIACIESDAQNRNGFTSKWSTLDDARDGLRKLETPLTQSKTILVGHKEAFINAQNLQSELESQLSFDLLASSFKTIDALRLAQLGPYEVQRIETKEKEIKTRSDRLYAQLEQVENELVSLVKNNAPQGDLLIEMQKSYLEMNQQVNDRHGALAVIQTKLQDDDYNHRDYASRWEELEMDRRKLLIWQKLSTLIGSHDGKVFKKFAQGLSFDLLIKCANNHLSFLNDRYRLKRLKGEELDLEIQDLHQANATRPTASLSGGESFLTSLALALGLSDLAGKNVRIDSLFIDEGFGSLDSETLEIAVQALEGLRTRNKTIGVISHIELLKERIPTQIVIKKGSGGVSTMSFSV